MEDSDVKVGLAVKTAEKLNETTGFMIHQKHIIARQPNKYGVVTGYVPGHGGDVWWVDHGNNQVGAYAFTELNHIL